MWGVVVGVVVVLEALFGKQLGWLSRISQLQQIMGACGVQDL